MPKKKGNSFTMIPFDIFGFFPWKLLIFPSVKRFLSVYDLNVSKAILALEL